LKNVETKQFHNNMTKAAPSKKKEPYGEVVDLFCGVGALSYGLKRAGLKIVAGYDTDARCQYGFEKNNNAKFHVRDVAKLLKRNQRPFYGKSAVGTCGVCAMPTILDI